MAKSAASKSPESPPKWKTKWPRNGDLRAWFVCMIEKCDAIEDPIESSGKAHLPIEALAKLGRIDEALKYVNRFLRKQTKDKSLETVRMSELGAKICLDGGNLERMEAYLHTAATAPVLRKCDFGWPEKSVREFRAWNGILDPAEAIDEEQWIEATFRGGERRFNDAWANNQTTLAESAVAEMEKAVKILPKDSFRYTGYHQVLLISFAKLGNLHAIKRYSKSLGKESEAVLDYRTLWKLGMETKAFDKAAREVDTRLMELAKMNDPNIHFPIHAICAALDFLVSHDKQQLAQTKLKKVLEDMGNWFVYEVGWTTSAVYSMLAEIVAKIEGPEAAEDLIANAHQDADSEKRSGWRKGSLAAALTTEAELGRLEEALARARKIRSRPERRLQLCKLLARAERWKELVAVCSEVESPEEAADLCWAIKFVLPGGAPGATVL